MRAIEGTVPPRIAALPVDPRGYPVPYFVGEIDGKLDFRVIDPAKLIACVKFARCWICGQRLGAHRTFVVGPMCAVSGVSAEPPSHRDCAEFAARVCPFLVMPRAVRREATLPANLPELPGHLIDRNPGVSLLWTTKSVRPFRVGEGLLFRMGEAKEILAYREGRHATNAELRASFESGIAIMRATAETEGRHAVAMLDKQERHARALLRIP